MEGQVSLVCTRFSFQVIITAATPELIYGPRDPAHPDYQAVVVSGASIGAHIGGVGSFGGYFIHSTTNEVYGLICAHTFTTEPDNCPDTPSHLKIAPTGQVRPAS